MVQCDKFITVFFRFTILEQWALKQIRDDDDSSCTKCIDRAFARLILKIQKFICRCILT